MKLRGYQTAAVDAVNASWKSHRSVLLVAPTGAGKTVLGQALINGRSALWVAHRRELVEQTSKRLGAGVIAPGYHVSPRKSVQVGTVQTLLARGARPNAEVLVLDEAHHYMAEEWRALVDAYPDAKILGLTATPERADGEPLGDIFEEIVVAANYSELIRDGHLVTVRAYHPKESLGNDLAMDPVDAWVKYSEGSQAFVFCGRVHIADELASRFRGLGVIAKTIEYNTPTRERAEAIDAFRRGSVKVLTNVYALTEGVDVPESRCCILARAFGHVGSYLQAVGRVLRPAKGKPDAILIDLTGTSRKHGLPIIDRAYSLGERPISGEAQERECSGAASFEQKVVGAELVLAHPGAGRTEPSREAAVSTIDIAERHEFYLRTLETVRKHRMRDGFASVRYREKYGEEPRREWV